jgi:hypothetical protein
MSGRFGRGRQPPNGDMVDLPDQPSGAAPAPAGTAVAKARIASSEQAEMAALVARMRTAAREAGIDDDGPLTPLLEAIMVTLDHLGTVTDRNARLSEEHLAGLRQILDIARQAADAETARFRAGLDAIKADVIHSVARQIGQSADAALTRRVRVFSRNTALIAAAVLVGSILGAFGAGYWRGSSTANAAIHDTVAGLQAAAFDQGPDAARLWHNLMTWNRIEDALAQCHGNALSRQVGRLACDVPLWIEKPVPAPPPGG